MANFAQHLEEMDMLSNKKSNKKSTHQWDILTLALQVFFQFLSCNLLPSFCKIYQFSLVVMSVCVFVCLYVPFPWKLFQGLSLATTGHMISSQAKQIKQPPLPFFSFFFFSFFRIFLFLKEKKKLYNFFFEYFWIGATLRIGQESQCLPYVGFFSKTWQNVLRYWNWIIDFVLLFKNCGMKKKNKINLSNIIG